MTNENGNIFRYLSEMSKENILCARTEFNKQGKPRPGKDKTYFFHYLNKNKTAKIHIQELIYKHLILQECIIIKNSHLFILTIVLSQ